MTNKVKYLSSLVDTRRTIMENKRERYLLAKRTPQGWQTIAFYTGVKLKLEDTGELFEGVDIIANLHKHQLARVLIEVSLARSWWKGLIEKGYKEIPHMEDEPRPIPEMLEISKYDNMSGNSFDIVNL